MEHCEHYIRVGLDLMSRIMGVFKSFHYNAFQPDACFPQHCFLLLGVVKRESVMYRFQIDKQTTELHKTVEKNTLVTRMFYLRDNFAVFDRCWMKIINCVVVS